MLVGEVELVADHGRDMGVAVYLLHQIMLWFIISVPVQDGFSHAIL